MVKISKNTDNTSHVNPESNTGPYVVNVNPPEASQYMSSSPSGFSEFRGGVLEYWIYQILMGLIIVFTFGLATPWCMVKFQQWKASNTIINGMQLRFDGEPMDLFVQYIKWWFLCLVTLGIYSLWVVIKLEQWIVKHTHFA